MTYLISALIGLATLGGTYFVPYDFPPFEHDSPLCVVFPSSRLCADFNLGAVSYPASLDVFENPGASASVATVVTHSTHHANANDALEALEAKVGTGASTPTNNTIFVGDGTGTSSFSSSATSTNFLATNFTTASSTIASTSVQRLLATNATSTNFHASNRASTTDIRANTGNIGNLTVTSCTGCTSGSSAVALYEATTTSTTAYATTTTLTIGDDVLIWAQCQMGTISNSSISIALYVKPSGSATSSALGIATTHLSGSSDGVSASVFGLYTALATGSHEIYLGDVTNKNYNIGCVASTAKGIMYLVIR